MTKLIPICFIAFVLCFMYEKSSIYSVSNLGERFYEKKDKFFFFILALSMATLVGLRSMGNDTGVYIGTYLATNTDFSEIEWSFGANPGFILINKLMRLNGISVQNYLMIYAVFTIFVYLWFVRKYSERFSLSIFFFITMGAYTFTMAAIKQTVAVAFCLIATDKFINKKRILFFVFVIIAELFHPFSFIYLVVPLLNFPLWSKKTILVIIITIVIAFFMPFILPDIGSFASTIGKNYAKDEFTGEGVSLFRVLVMWTPFALSIIFRKRFLIERKRVVNLVLHLALVNSCVMFLGLFGTGLYFARLANYFLIFQTIALPIILNKIDNTNRKIITAITVICYILYFLYETSLTSNSFDRNYYFWSLSDYFSGRCIYA